MLWFGSALVSVWLALLAFPAAGASATGSIAFIKDHNVWLATPDGARQVGLTTDGTAGAPYWSPSQADDGTLMAARGSQLIRLARTGTRLATLAAPASAIAPDVSPDGTKVAYHVTGVELCGWLGWACGLKTYSLYGWTDRPAGVFDLDDDGGDLAFPSWMNNQRTVHTLNATVYTNPVGPAPEQHWWSDGALVTLTDAEVSRAGDKVVLVRGVRQETVQLYAAQGPPPVDPVPTCSWTDPVGDFRDPTWSPDGSAFAVADDAGVWVLPECGDAPVSAPLLPGASHPDWGPADVPPAKLTPPPPPLPSPPSPASPTTTVKLHTTVAAAPANDSRRSYAAACGCA